MRTELMSDPFAAGDADPEETPQDQTRRLIELLRPAVNRIAQRIYEEHGSVVPPDFDFLRLTPSETLQVADILGCSPEELTRAIQSAQKKGG